MPKTNKIIQSWLNETFKCLEKISFATELKNKLGNTI